MQIDALIHTLTLAGYEAESFVLSDSIKRGNDIGDLVHSLYHPDASVDDDYSWNTISDNEKEYIKQIGMKSVINFINPFVFNVDPFDLSSKKDKSILLTFDMAYALAPFGDFINENAYFKFGKFNIKTYGREYCNKNCVFPGFGIKLVDYRFTTWCSASFAGHFWIEPDNLCFTAENGNVGGAVEAETRLTLGNIGILLSMLYKTAGYMPGVEQHDQYFKVSCGLLLKC